MAVISLDIEDAMVGRLNDAARMRNCTVSKYVATIVAERLSEAPATKLPRSALRGWLKGKVWMADDFNAPIEDMREYMQ
jgi:predicted DNA-binding ribbon-helix-helix protein